MTRAKPETAMMRRVLVGAVVVAAAVGAAGVNPHTPSEMAAARVKEPAQKAAVTAKRAEVADEVAKATAADAVEKALATANATADATAKSKAAVAAQEFKVNKLKAELVKYKQDSAGYKADLNAQNKHEAQLMKETRGYKADLNAQNKHETQLMKEMRGYKADLNAQYKLEAQLRKETSTTTTTTTTTTITTTTTTCHDQMGKDYCVGNFQIIGPHMCAHNQKLCKRTCGMCPEAKAEKKQAGKAVEKEKAEAEKAQSQTEGEAGSSETKAGTLKVYEMSSSVWGDDTTSHAPHFAAFVAVASAVMGMVVIGRSARQPEVFVNPLLG